MQQTEQYKLNKPEADDPFSVVPLNENTDKLEGALSALDQGLSAINRRQMFHKLLTATAAKGAQELSVDLSGIDWARYSALVMFYSIYESVNVPSLYINNTGGMVLIPGVGQATNSHHGGGFAFFIPDKERVYGVCLRSTYALSTIAGGAGYGMFSVPWTEMSAMKLSPFSDQSTIVLYGLRF